MTEYKQVSEFELIDKIINGDNMSFEALIRCYNSSLYKIGRSYGFNHQDVEDLMQETYINAYKHLADLKERAYFKTWITRIMLNECYRKSNKTTFEKTIDVDFFSTNSALPVFSNNNIRETEKDVDNRELNTVIKNAIKQIPLEYRLVFSLRELNGMSVLETAHILDLTETNVKVRLNRAKAMLRKEVQKTYSQQEIFEFNLIYCNKIVTKVIEGIMAHSLKSRQGE
jgi:RNA polymerase sigma factor (sigma-70 family)